MFDRACQISILFFALFFGSAHQALACSKVPDPRFTCFDLPVSLSDAGTVAEVVMPVARSPRAVVIVLPGTGGLSDPYFDAELQQKNYDPQHRGGLTAALTLAGYAVVFYSQRGYKPLGHCVTGQDFWQRARAFVFNCIDPVQRARVDLKTITSDTQQVFDAVSGDARLRGLPHIPLAFSEGFYHLATLVFEGRYLPAGIVTVGGPQDSLSATFAYQFRREFYVDLTQRAFARCLQERANNLEQISARLEGGSQLECITLLVPFLPDVVQSRFLQSSYGAHFA